MSQQSREDSGFSLSLNHRACCASCGQRPAAAGWGGRVAQRPGWAIAQGGGRGLRSMSETNLCYQSQVELNNHEFLAPHTNLRSSWKTSNFWHVIPILDRAEQLALCALNTNLTSTYTQQAAGSRQQAAGTYTYLLETAAMCSHRVYEAALPAPRERDRQLVEMHTGTYVYTRAHFVSMLGSSRFICSYKESTQSLLQARSWHGRAAPCSLKHKRCPGMAGPPGGLKHKR